MSVRDGLRRGPSQSVDIEEFILWLRRDLTVRHQFN
jgi:hypothetical protein